MNSVDKQKEVAVATVEEITVDIPKEVLIEETSIAIFKTKDDTIFALENKCPHRGGPLSQGIVSGEHVFCPLHDWKISLNDGEAQGPDEGCTISYDTKIENNTVYLLLK
ncbi:nitrite reductase small subunit NirD [uncultured Marinococcus sp.]|jgi:nitrite reductase (NADH) small subunit|uniref:nitrite reductase small subunit NirD n=1 Tax=uncultured Marinococcus sp. TaxID=487012 RepID=UPI00261A351C|nr:nitrite reductase small subunit NirD [uncultured Marinococcus sp.]